MTVYTDRQLGYARAIVATGRSLGVADRGIKIGLATTLVETNLLNYANRAVPGSLTVPYDAIGSDSKSVGLFQQQPQWWGRGDGIDLMDPATSARLFFQQLLGLDYNNTSRTPGWYAQTVQRSAFPNRYDERFAEASALYDQIASSSGGTVAKPPFTEIESMGSSCSSRSGQKPRYIFLHTQEGNGTAQSLAAYLNNPNNGASYHYTVDNSGVVVDVVDTDYASWSVGDANGYSINLCFAGSYAGWSRQQWLNNMGRAIDIAAYLVAQDCKKYGIAAAWLGSGGSYRAASSGVSDHQYVTSVIGWGSHTDCGKGFPGDVFAASLTKYISNSAPVVNQIDAAAAVAKAWIGARITKGENICPDKVGRWAEFANAHIYWTPQTGAHPIPHGGLFEAWAEHKWETGPLGYPVRDHAVLADGGVQAFQGGVLYRKNGADHGYFVHGAIGARYAADGYEKSDLGWPTSDEYKSGTGISQDFDNGTLHWEPSGVVKTIRKA